MSGPVPSQSGIQTVLRGFLLQILPAGVEVISAQDNRVPEPAGDFVTMTVSRRGRLSTNVDTYQDCAFEASIADTVMALVHQPRRQTAAFGDPGQQEPTVHRPRRAPAAEETQGPGRVLRWGGGEVGDQRGDLVGGARARVEFVEEAGDGSRRRECRNEQQHERGNSRRTHLTILARPGSCRLWSTPAEVIRSASSHSRPPAEGVMQDAAAALPAKRTSMPYFVVALVTVSVCGCWLLSRNVSSTVRPNGVAELGRLPLILIGVEAPSLLTLLAPARAMPTRDSTPTHSIVVTFRVMFGS